MVSKKDKSVLLHIIKHCNRVSTLIKDLTYEQLLADQDKQECVCFNILQIGELCNVLSDEFITKHSLIPWKDIINMRNRVVHKYDTVDYLVVYETSIRDVPDLKKFCSQVIEEN